MLFKRYNPIFGKLKSFYVSSLSKTQILVERLFTNKVFKTVYNAAGQREIMQHRRLFMCCSLPSASLNIFVLLRV